MQQVQNTINDIFNLLLGVARVDKTLEEELLARSGLPALNSNSRFRCHIAVYFLFLVTDSSVTTFILLNLRKPF